MKTLFDLGQAVIEIREAIDQLRISDARNAAIIVYCNSKCNEIVNAVNEAAKSAPPGEISIQLNAEAVPKEQNAAAPKEQNGVTSQNGNNC